MACPFARPVRLKLASSLPRSRQVARWLGRSSAHARATRAFASGPPAADACTHDLPRISLRNPSSGEDGYVPRVRRATCMSRLPIDVCTLWESGGAATAARSTAQHATATRPAYTQRIVIERSRLQGLGRLRIPFVRIVRDPRARFAASAHRVPARRYRREHSTDTVTARLPVAREMRALYARKRRSHKSARGRQRRCPCARPAAALRARMRRLRGAPQHIAQRRVLSK